MPDHYDLPANLITGFLGVGKTTTIRELLAQRPKGEQWAVLVNEFGEIGVDAGLLADTGVALEEIPGGCLCCVSAQMFTVGLNRLIRSRHPDRILIEPTGLGHPAEIIRTLTAPPYDQVLDLRATLTVMDARHLASPRHREHPNWKDQIALADVLIANKADQYGESEHTTLMEFVATLPEPRPQVIETRHGQVDVTLLDRPRLPRGGALFPEARAFLAASQDHDHEQAHAHAPETEPASDWITIDNRGDGYIGRSWRFPDDTQFRHAALEKAIRAHPAERLKGILQTDLGWMHLNRVGEDGTLEPAAPPAAGEHARLELIQPEDAPASPDALDRALRAARLRSLPGPGSPAPTPWP